MKQLDVDIYLEKTAGPIWEATKNLFKTIWEKTPTWGKILIPAAVIGGTATGIIGGLAGSRQSETMSYRINRALNTLTDRIRADEVIAESFARNLGSSTANELVGLTKDIITKGYETLKDTLSTSPVRQAIFNSLKQEDPILSQADNKTLLEAYHTMAKVAPTLSTDKNAVKSFLTQAVVSGGGLDYQTIKGIADAEAAVARAKMGK